MAVLLLAKTIKTFEDIKRTSSYFYYYQCIVKLQFDVSCWLLHMSVKVNSKYFIPFGLVRELGDQMIKLKPN